MIQPKRILVVDDEERNLSLLNNMLESLGYEAVLANSAVEAFRSLAPDIDLVLLDVMMPETDGFEVCRRIRNGDECSDVPIIMVTILSSREDRLRAAECGANDFISKPIDRVELRIRMASLLKMKEAQDRIKASLREKQDLLREMHHRIKNNFAVLTSFLRLQARRITDETLLSLLRETESRVRCMWLVHDKLHQSESLTELNVSRYLQSLVAYLMESLGSTEKNISVKTDFERISLGVDTAIPIGIITSELLINTVKHAFPGNEGGEVRVSLKAFNDQEFELLVADNGVGLPAADSGDDRQSLGMDLVSTFVKQLEASMDKCCDKGTEFKIRFKELERRHRI
jgi:two-component sensor histidine kinase